MTLQQGWTVREAINRAGDLLAQVTKEYALESGVLMAHTLKMDRVQLFLDPKRRLTPEQFDRFQGFIERRLKGEPMAYIVGRREFYGLDFYVDSNVLIPRPETELLVEKALNIAKHRSITTIADIGTGSGAIAISLALQLPNTKIYATDISAAALKVAAVNCGKHGVADKVCLLEGDLLEPLPEPVDLIVANLPYVRQSDLAGVNTHGFEPELALDGGADGLDLIRHLIAQLLGKLNTNGDLLLEVGAGQAKAVTVLLKNAFPSARIETFKDLAKIERVVACHFEKC